LGKVRLSLKAKGTGREINRQVFATVTELPSTTKIVLTDRDANATPQRLIQPQY